MAPAQMELDFTPRHKRAVSDRPHFRETTLTISRSDFDKVVKSKPGEICEVCYVNDIISSALGGKSKDHHPIRRVRLLQRQFRGGWKKLKLRYEKDCEIECLMAEIPEGQEDASALMLKLMLRQEEE